MANPYERWNTRKSLGVMRAVKVEKSHYRQFYTSVFRSEDEWIDFSKLPIPTRRLMPFAMPLGRGRGVYSDTSKDFRVKPAYAIADDEIDVLKGLGYEPGVDGSIFDFATDGMTVMQRREVLRARITEAHVRSWERRMEWLAAKATQDGKVTLTGPDYPTTLVDFGRDPDHTIVLGSGQRFSDSISKLDFIQSVLDMMVSAEFGGMVTKITMGNLVVPYLRKDTEILDHMDVSIKGGVHVVERGLLSGGEDQDELYKFGELFVGGNSGQRIELWVDNRTYENDAGAQVRFTGAKDMVFTASPSRINGFECFGRIIDQDAEYKAIPLYPKNYETGEAVKTEHIRHTSSPLSVPVNADATAKATVLA